MQVLAALVRRERPRDARFRHRKDVVKRQRINAHGTIVARHREAFAIRAEGNTSICRSIRVVERQRLFAPYPPD